MLARLHRVTIFISLSQSVTQGNTMQHHAQRVIQPTQSDIETKATKGAEGRKVSSARIATKASSSHHSARAINEFTRIGNLISASIVINASSSPSSSGSMNELTRAKNRMNASIVKPYQCKYCGKCFAFFSN